MVRSFLRFIYEIIEVFVISASIFVVVYLFLMQPHQVKGSSMFPTFKDGEYLLTDKITYKRRDPIWGDVIVFKAPINENFDFIKRVIAIPEDTIKIQAGKIYVNDKMLDEDYLPKEYTTSPGQFLKEGLEFRVPEGTVMAIGDNRDHSSDSRDWGPVPYQNIVGRAFFRYWPTNKVGVIANPRVDNS
ncbi:signal peptidase I [Candidatus Collierbacteria bacterium]|nr:signal peptidase I [Candidatus Collierbacteria bacterium]